MSNLTWDTVGERYFELGLDRGVLYPQEGPGVPWNGLIKVDESPSGGEAVPLFIDGVKYLNVASQEEFEGSIEAYTYPDAFMECDGTASIGGLTLNQQVRKPFGLSYRTKLGSDLAGLERGYKLHLIYNALAAPAQKSNNTVGDNPDPMSFNWSFTTTRVKSSFAGYLPMTHITIDSTKTSTTLMRLIEEHLYGTATTDPLTLDLNPSIIPIDQLIEWFKNPPELLTIIPNEVTGLSKIINTDSTGVGDLLGVLSKGLYVAPNGTRLTKTATPGLSTLEY